MNAERSSGIVGLNGAAKTTLVKLLSRLHEPTGGGIGVDGADLRAMTVLRYGSRQSNSSADPIHSPPMYCRYSRAKPSRTPRTRRTLSRSPANYRFGSRVGRCWRWSPMVPMSVAGSRASVRFATYQ